MHARLLSIRETGISRHLSGMFMGSKWPVSGGIQAPAW